VALYGYPRLTSPAIDRLARRAAVFTNAITQAPYTKAAIASLMSGLSPAAHKTVTASVPLDETMTGHLKSTPPQTDCLPSDIVTLAETLRSSGYQTVGMTANPFLIAPFGFAQGFDTFEFLPGPDFAGADRLVDRALAAVGAAGPAPVFLWIHLMEPHSPYVPPGWTANMFPPSGPSHPIPADVNIPPWLLPGSPRDLRPYQSNYDDEIAAADVAVDVLLRGFGVLRDASNTVTVVTADHGEQFLDHGGFEHNDTLYDELIRIPLIIQIPEAASVTVNAQVQLLDLYSTLAALANAEVPDGTEGRDLTPFVLGRAGSDASEPAFAENGALTAVRVDGWKLIRRKSDGGQVLFNLKTDPHEQRDIAASAPARVASLGTLLDRHTAASEVRGRRIRSTGVAVDREILEQLRALGYTGK
jgi:arylsulfatase A-like enzyme